MRNNRNAQNNHKSSFALNFLTSLETVVQRCSLKKVFLEISQNSQENTCARVSFSIKVHLYYMCFPVNFVTFLRTPFLKEHLWWLLLPLYIHCNATDSFLFLFGFYSIIKKKVNLINSILLFQKKDCVCNVQAQCC